VLWRPSSPGEHPVPHFDPPAHQARMGGLSGSAILEVGIKDKNLVRERLKELRGGTEDGQDVVDDPNVIVWEITSAWGNHLLEGRVGDNCRELARRFCRDNRMDLSLSLPLGERMEIRLREGGPTDADWAPTVPGMAPPPGPAAKVEGPKRKGPKPKIIDFGDKEAVHRRVRALQKKLREIEKLKLNPEACVDKLQRDKLAAEGEVRAACVSLERELDLLERLPRMVFDVETEDGKRYIEFREGDDCLELARQFCRRHDLDKDLARPLAAHMEQKLREQDIIQEG